MINVICVPRLIPYSAEEDLNDENPKVEIALDDEGNPEVPAWTGQKLKVQQSLARMVFQAAYGMFLIVKCIYSC